MSINKTDVIEKDCLPLIKPHRFTASAFTNPIDPEMEPDSEEENTEVRLHDCC